jgi:predicted nucleic acid-binding protein
LPFGTAELVPARYRFPHAPDDEPYLNLAIAARAQFLVTRDKDLLDLMNWRKKDGREFRKRFRKLKIVDPASFVKEIEKRKQQPE